MRVAIRADASSRIGLGHVLRCLSLAHALREAGAEVLFLLRPSDVPVADRVRATGFATRELPLPAVLAPGKLDDAVEDARSCAELLRAYGIPEWLIVDHYGLAADWHEHLRAKLGCRIAAIDDLADRPLAVDALIDHNLALEITHRQRYEARLSRAPQRWFCGPRFALLGPAYADLPRFEVRDEVRSLGLFLGGTDPLQLSAPVLRACRAAGFDGAIEVVSTAGAPGLAALRTAICADGNARLTLDLPNLAAFYGRHDLQIGAGGGASWERCAVGTPSLTLCTADNQRAVIPALVELGASATSESLTAESISQALRPLLEDKARRLAQSECARNLVDGQGARRVALGLLALAGPMPRLRLAGMDDAQKLWAWRNHPVTRAVSRQTGEIPFDAHCVWLERLLSHEQSLLFIAAYGGLEFGVIRFDPLPTDTSEHWEVSLYLAPALHGLGLGRRLLQTGEQAMKARTTRHLLIHAEVLHGNHASLALFIDAGYVHTSDSQLRKALN